MMGQRTLMRLEGISAYVAVGETRKLFIDGIFARISIQLNVMADGTEQGILIDGQPLTSFSVIGGGGGEPEGPISIEFPIVYGSDGIPIAYDQQVRITATASLNAARVVGFVQQLYLVNT